MFEFAQGMVIGLVIGLILIGLFDVLFWSVLKMCQKLRKAVLK